MDTLNMIDYKFMEKNEGLSSMKKVENFLLCFCNCDSKKN